ncbi:TPA: orotate phosphoribosyltransferase [Candidatus Woesearchaeota archaeon]|nr:Orotate phosphoribosyltransferase [archaeon GW2011_AR15]MBS3104095.1 orotate phosphoribosyltransferase [Candidatus Woesearchaeota archaeon]HIH41686.1 orotate phosphoribosyltransferase [Candidatus Woesearchaeota archaeon]
MKERVAEILLKIKAVEICPNSPFTYTSGMISPIYIDNRKIISYPEERRKILEDLCVLIGSLNIKFDVIAGVATAGIHWAAWLSEKYNKPMVYIRDSAKGHGKQNQIEGYLEKGKKVLVIEDHISTGGSSIAAVKAVREFGCEVTDCIAITTYEFREAKEKFDEEKCGLHTLTDFTTLIKTAAEKGYISSEDEKKVLEWNKSPQKWGKKHGFEK